MAPSTTSLDIAKYANLRKVQEQDCDIKPILLWKKQPETQPDRETVAPHSPATKIILGSVEKFAHQRRCAASALGNPSWRQCCLAIAIAKSMRRDIFLQLHATPTSGHMGVKKTLDWITQRFYWPHCQRDVTSWCSSWDLCSSRHGPPKKPRVPMSQYNVGAPSKRVAMDVLGPLLESEYRNKYLFLVADYFTK